MRILILGINYAPELAGIGKYSGEMAEWLAVRGHEVRVVTAPPYYPDWKIREGYSGSSYKREKLNGVEVYRCPLWVPGKVSGPKRILHLLSFAVSSFPVMLRQIFWRPEVVFVIEPPFSCAPQAWLVARLSGAKAWIHVQDFEVDAAFDLGLLPWGKIRNIILSIERSLLRGFDKVSTISGRMVEKLESKGVDAKKRVLFPNWVDTKSIFPLDCKSPMRDEWGISGDAMVCLYSGNMGEKQGLDAVIEAARLLASEPLVRFVLCGSGAAKERMQEAGKDLTNISWFSLQPVEKLNDLLNLADIHLLPQRADVADLVMPSKLTGMLASGKPVIATAHFGTEVAEVVGQCGLVIEPGDAEKLAQAILALARDPALRQKLGHSARQYALEYLDKEAVLRQFERDLCREG